MQGGTKDVEFLARSQTRVRLVEELHREGELGRDELRDRLDASRTTVQRNLEALESRGWIRNGNRTYSLATCGEIIADDFLSLVDTVAVVERLQPVLEWMDTSKLDFDLGLLEDADVVTPKPGDPWAMVNRHVTRLKEASQVEAVLPLTGLHAMEIVHDRVVSHDSTIELVVTPEIVDAFRRDPAYKKYHDELIQADRYDVYCYDGEIPYYLGVLDDFVQIGVDGDGKPQALLETKKKTVRKWASRTIDEYRSSSDPVRY